ncbi:MAG: acyl-CoA dehydrogenase family protein, partial [Acidobacteriota bacterium]|nr:acyl-CoA dehydrogenase family protein [Acidobacteriota bacterium]
MVLTEAKRPGSAVAEVRPGESRVDQKPAGKQKLDDGGAFLLTPVEGEVFCRERFSEEQVEIERMVRDFATERIAPQRDELAAHNEKLTRELLREVGELGLAGVDIPERYGGMGLDKTTSALVVEALTTAGAASWVVTFSAHTGIGTLPVVFFGNEEQKQRYLPKLASVESLSAYSLSEAEAGSDALSLGATARLSEDGTEYILNGSKIYVTNGGWADLYTVFAKIDGKLMSAFLVERGSDGLTIGPEEKKLGIRGSSTVSLFLENVKVPVANLLGKPGDGAAIALNILNIGRFKLGAADLGGCKWATDATTRYALDRRQFGQPIAFFEANRKKLAEMVVRTYTLDSVIYRTVGLIDRRIAELDPEDPKYNQRAMDALEEYAIEASISKILGSESMFQLADHGIQIYGGNGFSEEYPMAAASRNTRIDRIFEGTNEINRMVIYGYYLKKALMEELPLRDVAKTWLDPAPAAAAPAHLEWEMESLDIARRLTVRLLHEAISRFGQDLKNSQVVGEDLADLIIGYFGASSAINRIRQLAASEAGASMAMDNGYRSLARLVVAMFLEDVWRIYFRLRP